MRLMPFMGAFRSATFPMVAGEGFWVRKTRERERAREYEKWGEARRGREEEKEEAKIV